MIENLRSMDPFEFEKLVASLWEKKGYRTTIKDQSHDRGIDIEAKKGDTKELLQVKRYNSENRVGSNEVRMYSTLYNQESNVDKVVIITSGEFTEPAKSLSEDLNIELVDGEMLLQELHHQGLTAKVREHPKFEEQRRQYLRKRVLEENTDLIFNQACPDCKGDIAWVQGGPGICLDCSGKYKFYEIGSNE